MLASFLRSTVLLGLCATFKADPTACETAFFNLVSEDACGNENGPDASSACTATCKPLACSVVSSCTDGSSIAYADEKGPASISADEVRSIVKELESEHTNCPCSAAKRSNLTKAFQTMRKSAKKDPVSSRGNVADRTQEPAATACETAFFNLVSEDACGNENGPDASSACSATCKPLACSVVSSCTDGSSIAYADEKGPASISADEVRSIVKELESEHTNCPCSAAKRSNLTKAFQTMRKSAKKDPVSLRGNVADRTQEPAATACETAFFNLVSEDACGNENGPDASSACSATCKPLACSVVSSCTDGSSIAYADEKGPASISADEVRSIVKELESEHTNCPCSAAKRSNLTKAFQTMRKSAKKDPVSLRGNVADRTQEPAATACETAFFNLVSEDACGNENGPDASSACSATCKPLACSVVSSCTDGSSIAYADEKGPASISADEVRSIVKELESEHTNCPCSAAKRSNLTKAFQTMRKSAKKDPVSLRSNVADRTQEPVATACETAFFNLVSEDACGNENGPDASSACSATCKPLACSVVSSCTDGSSIAYADEKGPASISADEVRELVAELRSEHKSCAC